MDNGDLDYLLTPQNCALIIIDFQPMQVESIASMDRRSMVLNAVSVARAAKLYELPIVLSTVNIESGNNQQTIHKIQEVLGDVEPIKRTTLNAWEDKEFVSAVKEADRRKLIMMALWTDVSLTFPALSALREGFEVYPVVDAVGSMSIEGHKAGLWRMIQAGAVCTNWAQLLCELQRDWRRKETVQRFSEILFSGEGR